MGKVPAIVRCLSDYDVWNKESGLGWDTVVAVQYALRSKMKEVYVMRDMRKNIYVMRDMRKNIYVIGEI